MKPLFVDAGNTNIKWRYLDSTHTHQCSLNSAEFRSWLVENVPNISGLVVSSVQSQTWKDELQRVCTELRLDCWFAHAKAEESGLVSAYSKPQHLGVDRWLAMLALWRRKQRGFLVVDAGSAITIDLVNDEGNHLGGYILPGIGMQRATLLARSSRLDSQVGDPLAPNIGLGADTDEAIDNGVYASVTALIKTLMAQERSWLTQVVYTGGDGAAISALVGGGEVEQSLVFEGLQCSWSLQKIEGGS